MKVPFLLCVLMKLYVTSFVYVNILQSKQSNHEDFVVFVVAEWNCYSLLKSGVLVLFVNCDHIGMRHVPVTENMAL